MSINRSFICSTYRYPHPPGAWHPAEHERQGGDQRMRTPAFRSSRSAGEGEQCGESKKGKEGQGPTCWGGSAPPGGTVGLGDAPDPLQCLLTFSAHLGLVRWARNICPWIQRWGLTPSDHRGAQSPHLQKLFFSTTTFQRGVCLTFMSQCLCWEEMRASARWPWPAPIDPAPVPT